jgi:hypothetical protein
MKLIGTYFQGFIATYQKIGNDKTQTLINTYNFNLYMQLIKTYSPRKRQGRYYSKLTLHSIQSCEKVCSRVLQKLS